ncbi:unnamed protein product [Tuber aestivum]|uniref:RING-type domain-containing protein n=1 Tax=Tuber aestivum TaxID=59557 RepID=A0A292Q0L6_9PEZI|nr:unnamed protein product [Tuber aestivum]
MASRVPLTLNFACVICMERKQTSSASPAISPSCSHPSNICKPCLQTYIEVALSSKSTAMASPPLKCPQCPNEITLAYVQETFPTLAPTYSDSLLQRYLHSIPEYRPCQKPSCPGGQLHSSRDKQPIVTCLMCSAKSCFTCRIPWHPSRTCAEVKSEHGENEKLLGKLAKSCPGCGVMVEKANGCDHLKCRCNCEWCWECRANYVIIRAVGNEGHGKTCPHWRGPAAHGSGARDGPVAPRGSSAARGGKETEAVHSSGARDGTIAPRGGGAACGGRETEAVHSSAGLVAPRDGGAVRGGKKIEVVRSSGACGGFADPQGGQGAKKEGWGPERAAGSAEHSLCTWGLFTGGYRSYSTRD